MPSYLQLAAVARGLLTASSACSAAVDAFLPREVYQKALADRRFEAMSVRLGLPMRVSHLNETIVTRQVSWEAQMT